MSTPIQLLPGTLPAGYCYPSEPQQFNFDIVTLIRASLNENFPGVYKGATDNPPPADQRDRIWVNTDNNLIYLYINGKWRRKYQFAASSGFLSMWTGTTADLATFDGGSAGAVSDSTGPLWEVVATFAGRTPIGVGDIPTSNPVATTTAPGQTSDSLGNSGEYKHTLTDLEGAVAQHKHPIGVCDPASDDGVFPVQASSTVPSWAGHYIIGGGGQTFPTETTANMFSLPSGTDGAGVTAVGHLNMQPWRTVYFIQRTARIFVEPPY